MLLLIAVSLVFADAPCVTGHDIACVCCCLVDEEGEERSTCGHVC